MPTTGWADLASHRSHLLHYARRRLHGQSTAEVCDTRHISGQNLHVRLHRARKALLC